MLIFFQVKLAAQFTDHGSTVWRVCWNVTGTILASSGDDGRVRLWKSNYMDNWKCVATLRSDGNSHVGRSLGAGQQQQQQQQQPPPLAAALTSAGGFGGGAGFGSGGGFSASQQKWHS